MPLRLFFALLVLNMVFAFSLFADEFKLKDEPDSAYLFSYNANGLRFAWSHENRNWSSIGRGYTYLKSDYGRWGAEKKMLTPFLIIGRNGEWVCIWSLNDHTNQFAVSTSKNLINWGPQSYPYVTSGKNVRSPVIAFNREHDEYNICYSDAEGKYFETKTKDFITYSQGKRISAPTITGNNVGADINGLQSGQCHRVAWSVIRELQKAYEIHEFKVS